MRVVFKRPESGSGMILALFVMVLVSAFGVSLVALAWNSLIAAKRDVIRARALACAEAGIDKAISFLMEGGPNGEAPGTWRTTHPSSDPDDHTNDSLYSFSPAPGETARICVRDGSGITAGKIVVTSMGSVTQWGRRVTRTIKVVLEIEAENVNVWNNAIFAAVGQAGRSINGNVAIRGRSTSWATAKHSPISTATRDGTTMNPTRTPTTTISMTWANLSRTSTRTVTATHASRSRMSTGTEPAIPR